MMNGNSAQVVRWTAHAGFTWAVVLLFCTATPTWAGGWRPTFTAAYECCGDMVGELGFDDGSTASIYAGEGYALSVGARREISASWEAEVAVGWKGSSVSAANGGVRFSRYPLNAFGVYKLGKHRLSAGLTVHFNPTLDGRGQAKYFDTRFDDAIGLVMRYAYAETDGGTLGVSYTVVNYSSPGVEFSGNSAGLFLSF